MPSGRKRRSPIDNSQSSILKPQSSIRNRQSAIRNPRFIAAQLLSLIEAGRISSQDLVSQDSLSALPDKDRSLAYEMILGTLRWHGAIDWILQTSSGKQLRQIDPELLPILRIAIFQLQFMSRIPEYAAVNESVKLARKKGAGPAGFVNAVLRQYLRVKPSLPGGRSARDQAIRTSHPVWLLRRWRSRFGEGRTEEIALQNNQAPDVAIRWNLARGEIPPEVRRQPGFRPCGHLEGCFHIHGRPCKGAEGEDYFYQDEASQLLAYLAAASPVPLSILDACAAPGGKAFLLAERFSQARLLLSDLSLSRLLAARRRGEQWGLRNADFVVGDAKTMAFRAPFDLVYVDAPCSGLGTIRRNPEIKWRMTAKSLTAFRDRQLKILQNVSRHVASGGQLVYATCSTEPEENGCVIDAFLAHSEVFSLEPIESQALRPFVSRSTFSTMDRYPEVDGFFGFVLRRR
ncbi:MAG TPA: transcription antitermination factor NusB [Acidobacteriota bacterium]